MGSFLFAVDAMLVVVPLAALIVVATQPAAAISRSGWDDLPRIINEGDEASYLTLMLPVLKAVRLSYTATYGSYRKPDEVNGTLGYGWKRVTALESNPEDGGFHALVFWDAATRRAILAIRGTDLGDQSAASAQADTCANRMLWDNVAYESLPAMCRHWSREDLDYLSLAEDFADSALESLRPSATLIVGHSLGAGLSVLVAAGKSREKLWHPQAVTLSAPPFNDVLRSRMHRDPSELQAQRHVLIYNVFDPLYRESAGPSGIGGSTVCTFSTKPAPQVCLNCYTKFDPLTKFKPTEWMKDPDCINCFINTHILKHYLDQLVGTLQRPPLYRPRCNDGFSSAPEMVV